MNKKLSSADYRLIAAALKSGVNQSEIACRFAISQGHVSKIKHKKLRALGIRKSNPKRSLIIPLKRIDYSYEQRCLVLE